MKFGLAFLFLVALCLTGCKGGSAPSLSGRWNMAMGPTTMQVEFGADGKYTGTMAGATGLAQVSGNYSVNGSVLEMDPPTITGPGGSVSPPGGRMKVKMTSQGPDMILLDAGDKKFTLTRIAPAK